MSKFKIKTAVLKIFHRPAVVKISSPNLANLISGDCTEMHLKLYDDIQMTRRRTKVWRKSVEDLLTRADEPSPRE